MLIVSGTGNESTRNSAGRSSGPRHPRWCALALIAACASAACAEAPNGTEFLRKADSAIDIVDLDSSAPIEQPIEDDPGPTGPGGTPGFTVPPFGQQQDASVQAPALDASRPPQTADSGRPPSNPPTTTPDSGRPPVVVDSGPVVTPQPDAGMMPAPSVNTCSTSPAFVTPDACTQCICARCGSQVMSCYASPDTAKNAQCKTVRDCALQNHCTGTTCYCADPLCFTPGPCAQVIDTAANGQTATAAGMDPENPVGRSNAVGMCSLSSCRTECGLM
jgi:hypothetical protein